MLGHTDSIAIAFDRIAMEKQYAANYLKNLEIESNYNQEANLLEREIRYWTQLSYNYDIFLKRGFVLSLPRSIYIMKQMENAIDNIISIEEDIIK